MEQQEDPRNHLIELSRAAHTIQNLALNALEELNRSGGTCRALSEVTKVKGSIEDADMFFRTSIEAIALQIPERGGE